jgi:hypothetical protein
MILDYIDKRYFQLVQFEDETIGAISNDGLFYMFEAMAELIAKLDKEYPNKDEDGWFFNSSRDRYCAEWRYKSQSRIIINPTAVSKLFGTPVVYNTQEGYKTL